MKKIFQDACVANINKEKRILRTLAKEIKATRLQLLNKHHRETFKLSEKVNKN